MPRISIAFQGSAEMLQSERFRVRCRKISPENTRLEVFSQQKHRVIVLDDFLLEPDAAIANAKLQKFAEITPQYPGLRAALEPDVSNNWLEALSALLSSVFGAPAGRWSMQGWHSIVTSSPKDLQPIQCLPHVDGTDPGQIAMMLYLHRTGHGGTAFFRHKATGLEALTAETFPEYSASLHREVAKTGLPPKAYVTDGAPHFERTYQTGGRFNQAVFYRGNILHSGVINNEEPLSDDPSTGRFTINAFLRPPNNE
jgi:hypothetical protein